jgi:ElaB/YqjD/DUF883 family membrane-anchored ribosome-binding protein
MEFNDRNRDPGLGGSSGNVGGSGREASGAGMSGSAGSANTPSFGGGFEGGTRTPGSSPLGSTGESAGSGKSALEEGKEIASERMEGMRNRVEDQLDSGMRTTADRMEGIAARLDSVADERMSGEGLRGRAGDVAHKVADRIENTAERLRDSDAHELLGRLENRVRERPLEMLLAGVATGWLVGKILR